MKPILKSSSSSVSSLFSPITSLQPPAHPFTSTGLISPSPPQKINSTAEPASAESKKKGISWDEENLSTNEEIKATFPSCKIDEPKTPFVRYDSVNDLVLSVGGPLNPDHLVELPSQLEPLQLEGALLSLALKSESDGEPTKDTEWDKDDTEDKDELERKRIFEIRRKQHYHMEASKPPSDDEIDEDQNMGKELSDEEMGGD